MVDKTNKRLSRRRVLQMSGVGLAGLAGSTGLSAASTKEPVHATLHNEVPEAARAGKEEQNTPKFTDDKSVGFAKGGFDNPVTTETVHELYSGVIGEQLNTGRVALPRPAKSENGEAAADHNVDEIMGIVVTVENTTPYISVHRKPAGVDPQTGRELSPDSGLSARVAESIEGDIHSEIDHKVQQHNGRAETIDGGA